MQCPRIDHFLYNCIIGDVYFGSKFVVIITILAERMARGSMVPSSVISIHADPFTIQSPFSKVDGITVSITL